MTVIEQIRRSILLFLFMWAGLPLGHADTDGHPTLDRFFKNVNTLRASFTQLILDENLLTLEESSGLLWIARPDRFRWDYISAQAQTIVADGRVLWIYDVELEQVTRRDQESAIGQTPAVLLAGGEQYRNNYKVTNLGKQGAITWFSLLPNSNDGGFTEIQFGFEGDTLRLIQMMDGLNQITRITLANIVENEPVSGSIFQFIPPTGVDVISVVE